MFCKLTLMQMHSNMKESYGIFYRKFSNLHIGHLQTLFLNNDLAREEDTNCYLIIDDRFNHNMEQLQQDLKFLELENIKIVPVTKYLDKVWKLTTDFLNRNYLNINYPDTYEMELDLNRIFHIEISNLTGEDETDEDETNDFDYKKIVFNKFNNGSFKLAYKYDYIIKCIQYFLNIKKVITSSYNYNHHNFYLQKLFEKKLHFSPKVSSIYPYHINNFFNIKSFLHQSHNNDPRLLTISGIRTKGIPVDVLYDFYKRGSESGSVSIHNMIQILMNKYKNKVKSYTVISNPIKIILTNWIDKNTEYILRFHNHKMKQKYYFKPLSNIVYIERSDFNDYFGENSRIYLKNAYPITSHEVERDENGQINTIYATIGEKIISESLPSISWVSSIFSEKPTEILLMNAPFRIDNETGNLHQSSVVNVLSDSYIKKDSDVLFINRVGYFRYSEQFSKLHKKPIYIRLSYD